MQPLDPAAEPLLREWIEKADADLEVARQEEKYVPLVPKCPTIDATARLWLRCALL
ncbi:MAG: hypothetical protein ABSF62_19390 [Bryobacteraceae bacterium]|jgi:hypothetical protein